MTHTFPRIRKPATCLAFTAAFGFFMWLLPLITSPAQSLPYTFTKVGPEYRLTLQANPLRYFGFLHTADLTQPFSTIKMALGNTVPIFGYTPALGENIAFFRARAINVAEVEDQDNDFIDDIWELQHAYLNPLAPNDAFLPSPEPDAAGRNNVDYYFWKRGTVRLREVFTREVSVFNFGVPTAAAEAISRAVSIFNGNGVPTSGIPEVYSRETSVFNFGSPLASVEMISREVSAFNFGSPPANVEAVSREVSVFNGDSVPTSGILEVYSREISTFNYGAPTASAEAISREVSVLNTAP